MGAGIQNIVKVITVGVSLSKWWVRVRLCVSHYGFFVRRRLVNMSAALGERAAFSSRHSSLSEAR